MTVFRTLTRVMNHRPETQWPPWVISLIPWGRRGKGDLITRETPRLREAELFYPNPKALAGAHVQRRHVSRYHSPSLCLYSFPSRFNYTHKQRRKRNPHYVGTGLGAKLVLSWMLSSKSSMRWRQLFNSSCEGNAVLIYIHKLEMKSYTIPSH